MPTEADLDEMLGLSRDRPPEDVADSMAEVQVYDGPLRFLVRSRKRDGVKHLVQLDAYNYNGACGCENFCNPLLRKLREGALPSDETRCYHIRRVREVLMDKFLREVSRRQSDTTQNDADGVT